MTNSLKPTRDQVMTDHFKTIKDALSVMYEDFNHHNRALEAMKALSQLRKEREELVEIAKESLERLELTSTYTKYGAEADRIRALLKKLRGGV